MAQPPIALVGLPGCGKGEVARIVTELGYQVFTLSEELCIILKQRNEICTMNSMALLSQQLRLSEGEGALAIRTVKRIQSLGTKSPCCFDGIRSPEEIEIIRTSFPDIVVIALLGAQSDRFYRSLHFLKEGVSLDDFIQRDQDEIKRGIGEVIANANYFIVHDTQRLEILRERTFVLMTQIQSIDLIANKSLVRVQPGAGILPCLDDGSIILISQFRAGIGCEILEIPSGSCKLGETEYACAARELREETGYSASTYISLGEIFPAPAYSNEKIILFLASGLTPGVQNPDYNEIIRVQSLTWDEIDQMVINGTITDTMTLIALFRGKDFLSKRRR